LDQLQAIVSLVVSYFLLPFPEVFVTIDASIYSHLADFDRFETALLFVFATAWYLKKRAEFY